MHTIKTLRPVLVAAALLAVTVQTAPASSPEVNLLTTAATAGSFNTWIDLAQRAGLDSVLRQGGPYTIFAPTDRAFALLPSGRLEELRRPENRARLRAILSYHVVPGRLTSRELVRTASARTLHGQLLRILNAGALIVETAKVTQADLESGNGVIHAIDAVLFPD